MVLQCRNIQSQLCAIREVDNLGIALWVPFCFVWWCKVTNKWRLFPRNFEKTENITNFAAIRRKILRQQPHTPLLRRKFFYSPFGGFCCDVRLKTCCEGRETPKNYTGVHLLCDVCWVLWGGRHTNAHGRLRADGFAVRLRRRKFFCGKE